MEFDILLRGGQLLDGTGGPGAAADIGVNRDRIAFIGSAPPDAHAALELDVSGLVVSPGFIDIHTHADIALLARPQHLPKVMQGVTTEVFTNCGLGFAPITTEGMQIQRRYIAGLFGDDRMQSSNTAGTGDQDAIRERSDVKSDDAPHLDWSWRTVADFLARFESRGMGANIAYLIPHGSVRVSVMGMEERPADAGEVARMRAMTAQGMEEGAWGLSTGIWYAPMRAAGREELIALCRTAGFFATHQRDYGDRIFEATRESLEIAREAGVPVQIAHLQMNGPNNAGRASDLLALLEEARRSGIDATCDTYPYTAGSTFIQSLLPEWAADGGPEALMRRLSESDARRRIVESLSDRSGADWQRYTLVGAQSAANRNQEGMNFAAAAAVRGLPVPDWLCAVIEEEEMRACFIHHAAHEGNVRAILQWPGQMIGSDGLHLPGKTHPRLHGTFPRVLGHYVRDEKVITLEQAVHKMTGQPAARLGLHNRGLLREGYAADIVVFDAKTVCDAATFDDPIRYPTGISYVFVNGIAVKSADQSTGALPGKVLRRA